MEGVRSTRALQQNENADEEVQQADDFKIALLAQETLRRGSYNDRGRENGAVPLERVSRFRPDTQLVQDLRDSPVVANSAAVDGFQDVTGPDPGFVRRSVRDNLVRLDTL